MTKFADDIRRIVGVDEDTATAPGLPGVGGQPAVKVVAKQGAGGLTVSTIASQDDNNEQLGLDKKGDSEEDRDAESEAEGQDRGDKPNSKSKTSGVVDADKVIDNEGGPDAKEDAPDVFSGSSFSAGTLTGINAVDCATGKTVNIRLDGLHVPPDATTWTDGTPKTSEWQDPNVPPAVPGFELGFKWSSATTVPYDEATPYNMDGLGAAIVGQNLGASGQTGGPGTLYGPNTFGNYYLFQSYIAISQTQFDVEMIQTDMSGTPIAPAFIAFNVTRSACTPGSGPSCPLTAPTETTWPEDDTISLTYEGGTYVTNQYDTDPTPAYTGQENSAVDFCMDGGRTGRIEAGINGGHILYETSGGAPTGTARYFNNRGELTGFSDAASIDFYRPKDPS
jgi:hypothetical protein